HACGPSRRAGKPVVPLLSAERELLLVDLPGHGDSPMPAGGTPPDPAGYALEVARLLDELGIETIAVCGNSIGGWTALELAKLGRASCVVALSPAGPWGGERRHPPPRGPPRHHSAPNSPPPPAAPPPPPGPPPVPAQVRRP